MPTIADVAASAGVGLGTVSRVLNGSPKVRAETRARVLDAIDTLGYRPNPLARGLSLGRCQTVGVVVPFFTHASAVERLRGVVAALDQSRYDLVLFNVESPVHREEHLGSLTRRDRADGLLIMSLPTPAEELERLTASGVPIVLVDAEGVGVTAVVTDDVAGGRIATRAPGGPRPPRHRLPRRRPRQLLRVHLEHAARARLPRGPGRRRDRGAPRPGPPRPARPRDRHADRCRAVRARRSAHRGLRVVRRAGHRHPRRRGGRRPGRARGRLGDRLRRRRALRLRGAHHGPAAALRQRLPRRAAPAGGAGRARARWRGLAAHGALARARAGRPVDHGRTATRWRSVRG